MKLTPVFTLGTIVYLRVNSERKGMVTGYLVRPGGYLLYLVSWDDPVDEKEHNACELSDTKSFDTPENEP